MKSSTIATKYSTSVVTACNKWRDAGYVIGQENKRSK